MRRGTDEPLAVVVTSVASKLSPIRDHCDALRSHRAISLGESTMDAVVEPEVLALTPNRQPSVLPAGVCCRPLSQ